MTKRKHVNTAGRRASSKTLSTWHRTSVSSKKNSITRRTGSHTDVRCIVVERHAQNTVSKTTILIKHNILAASKHHGHYMTRRSSLLTGYYMSGETTGASTDTAQRLQCLYDIIPILLSFLPTQLDFPWYTMLQIILLNWIRHCGSVQRSSRPYMKE